VESRAKALLALALMAKRGAEARPGQVMMTQEVERAFTERGHLLVEAGTGTGKSLAYLVPALLHATDDEDRRVVVATATKALQEQVVNVDLPFLHDVLEPHGLSFSYSMLKGRSNYACKARVEELVKDAALIPEVDSGELDAVNAWIQETVSGDVAETRFSAETLASITVGPDECPGAARCPFANGCFAERAKAKAGAADLVVVNTSLYAAHLASGGGVLPEHDAVVFDEAHTLEDVASSTFGVSLGPARITRLASVVRPYVTKALFDGLRRDSMTLEVDLGVERTLAAGDPVFAALESIRGHALKAHAELGDLDEPDAMSAVALTAVQAVLRDLGALLEPQGDTVTWVETSGRPRLRMAPLEVAPILAAELFSKVTVVATSATLAVGGSFDTPLARLGLDLPEACVERRDEVARDRPARRVGSVPSPFDYPRQGLLYFPDMPDPRSDSFTARLDEELLELARAANGRTLALFSARASYKRAAAAMAGKGLLVLEQDEMPRSELLEAFKESPGSVLFATRGFWTGVDIPGDPLTSVTIDRIPFPRPDEPLHQARKEVIRRSRRDPFSELDVPQAATLLAQAAGRLIRSQSDRGVVTIFDPRVRTTRYGATLLDTLPPLHRTRDPELVKGFLAKVDREARASA
jgi:ATP-dependent DNA helicase DinG